MRLLKSGSGFVPSTRRLAIAVLVWGVAANVLAAQELPSSDYGNQRSESRYSRRDQGLVGTGFLPISQEDAGGDTGGRRERWKRLSPEERERVKQGRERFKSLPPEDRERVKNAVKRFRELPPEEREELKKKWRESAGEKRRRESSY